MWIKQNWKLLPRYSLVTNDGQEPCLVWIFQFIWFVIYLHTSTCTDQFPTKDICDTFNGVKLLCPSGLLQKSTTIPLFSTAIRWRLVKVFPQCFPWTDNTTNFRLLISYWFCYPLPPALNVMMKGGPLLAWLISVYHAMCRGKFYCNNVCKQKNYRLLQR